MQTPGETVRDLGGSLRRRGFVAGAAALGALLLGRAAPASATDDDTMYVGESMTGTSPSGNTTSLAQNVTSGPALRVTNGALPYSGTVSGFQDGAQGYALGAENAGVSGRNDSLPTGGQVAYGVYGAAAEGVGVFGAATNGNDGNTARVGVQGSSDTGRGVVGTSGSFHGTYGVTNATSGNVAGVCGTSQSGTNVGPVIGVIGQGGTGVVGQSLTGPVSSPTPSSGFGVEGQSGSGYGVYGTASSGGGIGGASSTWFGVVGTSTSSHGIYGQSTGGAGTAGVFGVNAGSGSGPGIIAQSTGGYGVQATSSSNFGVYGTSTSNHGVYGTSSSAIGTVGASSTGVGVLGMVSSGGYGGQFVGQVFVEGSFSVTGTKSAVVPFGDGSHRRVYCVESPESWFEDFGAGQLAGGQANVTLDPDFAQTVKTDSYYVFLTPQGDSNGLFVSGQTGSGFTVQEQKAGTSTIRFSYRVVAKRKDVDAPRLEKVDVPAVPTFETPPAPKVPADLKMPPLPALPSSPSGAQPSAPQYAPRPDKRAGP